MRESQYQAKLIRRLKDVFPGCVILKNDSGYQQGVPDLIILFGDRWAMLEVKRSEESVVQPNQWHWVTTLDQMSFADFIYPENEEDVLNGLQHALTSRRSARVPKRK